MDLLIVFIIFLIFMGASLMTGISMLFPLALGLILFSIPALRRGHSVKKIAGFAFESLKESLIVVRILLIIGCLTGIWRLSGTVAYFVSAGVSLIPPALFIPACFLLSAAMSYAIGTSFGVSATAGVILMSIARAGGVNPILAAGAILSGVYVGDRGSPAASSANLVAVLTHTDMRQNVKAMLRCSLVPFFATLLLYFILSFLTPAAAKDAGVTTQLSKEFTLSGYCLIPAVLMIVLPFLNVSIRLSMGISLLSSVLISLFVQHAPLLNCLKVMILGYTPDDSALSVMLSGGGVISMLEVAGILIISCSYGKIFQKTGMLEPLNAQLKKLSGKIGRFPVMLLTAFALCMVFCNQTIGAILQSNLSEALYKPNEANEKMLDMENSVILVAGLVPWCIACSVPLKMLGADLRSLLFNFYLWLVPLWWLIRRKRSA